MGFRKQRPTSTWFQWIAPCAGMEPCVSGLAAVSGAAVESVLIKHGKNIINEQFLLNRLANATIDIYVSTCVLSRCSKSLSDGVASAQHEEMMAKLWCAEAQSR